MNKDRIFPMLDSIESDALCPSFRLIIIHSFNLKSVCARIYVRDTASPSSYPQNCIIPMCCSVSGQDELTSWKTVLLLCIQCHFGHAFVFSVFFLFHFWRFTNFTFPRKSHWKKFCVYVVFFFVNVRS